MNPFVLWSRVAWKTGAMAIAAAQVIGYRTGGLAHGGAVASPHNRREFALMGQEKGQAALASTQAAGARLLMLNQQAAAMAFEHMLSMSAALLSIAASRTPAEAAERQSKLVRGAMASSALAVSKLSGSTARVARAALTPVHARVSGNVRRLARKRK